MQKQLWNGDNVVYKKDGKEIIKLTKDEQQQIGGMKGNFITQNFKGRDSARQKLIQERRNIKENIIENEESIKRSYEKQKENIAKSNFEAQMIRRTELQNKQRIVPLEAEIEKINQKYESKMQRIQEEQEQIEEKYDNEKNEIIKKLQKNREKINSNISQTNAEISKIKSELQKKQKFNNDKNQQIYDKDA